MEQTKFALSHHATERQQQRGVSQQVIDLLFQFGTERPAGDGCVSLWADKRTLWEIRSNVEQSLFRKVESQLRNVYLIVGGASIVTVAHAR